MGFKILSPSGDRSQARGPTGSNRGCLSAMFGTCLVLSVVRGHVCGLFTGWHVLRAVVKETEEEGQGDLCEILGERWDERNVRKKIVDGNWL